jgi:hypothetical protein
MYKTANTLPEQIRSRSVALLNRHLASAIDLHAQVKQAHWNVRGPTFIRIPSHDSAGALGGAETRRPAAGRRTDAVARTQ